MHIVALFKGHGDILCDDLAHTQAGAALFVVSEGHIAHEAIHCSFLHLYIFEGENRIHIAPRPPPRERHPILQTCYITMQQAKQARAKIYKHKQH